METHNIKLDQHTTYQTHQGRSLEGDLITEVNLMVNAGVGCKRAITSAKYITANFYFAHADQNMKIDTIGYLGAYLLDRETDRSAFSQEMLETRSNDDNLDETRQLLQNLYRRGGGVIFGRQVEEYLLDVPTVLIIDHLTITAPFRQCGLGKKSMNGFLWTFDELMKQRSDLPRFGRTVICSPSMIKGERYEGNRDDGRGSTKQQVDEGLVRFFKRCGFNVWVYGDRSERKMWICGARVDFSPTGMARRWFREKAAR